MAKTLTARTLGKKLTQLDKLITHEYLKQKYDRAKIATLEVQQATLLKEAVTQKGLKLVSVQVADGSALYYEAKRTTSLVTFEWLHGGADGYVSDWGKTVVIPLGTANKMLKRFNPNEL